MTLGRNGRGAFTHGIFQLFHHHISSAVHRLYLNEQTDKFPSAVLFFCVQVSALCVRVPAACWSAEVSTDLSLRGKTTQCLKRLYVHVGGVPNMSFHVFPLKGGLTLMQCVQEV